MIFKHVRMLLVCIGATSLISCAVVHRPHSHSHARSRTRSKGTVVRSDHRPPGHSKSPAKGGTPPGQAKKASKADKPEKGKAKGKGKGKGNKD